MDNIFIERLWRSVKYEEIYLFEHPTLPALRLGLAKRFGLYNASGLASRAAAKTNPTQAVLQKIAVTMSARPGILASRRMRTARYKSRHRFGCAVAVSDLLANDLN